MKKKTTAILCMVIMMTGLSGCGNAIPDMSEEQSAIVTEYAAGLLLKYDKNYTTRLVDEEEMKADTEPETEAEEPSEQETEKAEEPSVSENQMADGQNGVSSVAAAVNIGSFLELGSIQVDYQGYEILDSYAEGNGTELAFATYASQGAKLVVAKFLLTNTGGEDADCDMLTKDVRFRIKYGSETKNALVTMLSDDFSTLSTTIPAGGSTTAVLIIEVKAEEVENLTDLSLLIRYGDDSVETKLQAETSKDTVQQQQQPEAPGQAEESEEALSE